jgi:hypothetical protein
LLETLGDLGDLVSGCEKGIWSSFDGFFEVFGEAAHVSRRNRLSGGDLLLSFLAAFGWKRLLGEFGFAGRLFDVGVFDGITDLAVCAASGRRLSVEDGCAVREALRTFENSHGKLLIWGIVVSAPSIGPRGLPLADWQGRVKRELRMSAENRLGIHGFLVIPLRSSAS